MSKVSIKNQKFRLGYPSTLVFDNMGKTINVFRVEYLRDIPRFNIKKGDKGGFVEYACNLSQDDDAAIILSLIHI